MEAVYMMAVAVHHQHVSLTNQPPQAGLWMQGLATLTA